MTGQAASLQFDTSVTSTDIDADAFIARAVDSASVVVFCSNVTDLGPIDRRMKGSGRSYQVVPMGMGSQLMRDRFHYLCGLTGRRTLPQVFVDGEFVGGYNEFLDRASGTQNDSHALDVPRLAWLLGYGGVVPFVLIALAAWFGPAGWESALAGALVTYSVAVLSFIGAVHWGVLSGAGQSVASRRRAIIYGVVPPLAAWFASLLPLLWALPSFLGVLLLSLAADARLLTGTGLPRNYLRLRQHLTFAVALSLVVAWAAFRYGS